MSSKSNVNPDHYKVAGRGRQGEAVVPDVEKKKRLEEDVDARDRRRAAKPGPPRRRRKR
jgi:hypothetical protein